jgi:hypothetical protein
LVLNDKELPWVDKHINISLASWLYASQLGESQHGDLVHFQKRDCHKMARIARCGLAFPLAWVAINISGETPEFHFSLASFKLLGYKCVL